MGHFAATSGNVKTMLLCMRERNFFQETDGPEQPQMHRCGYIFFRMRFGRHFVQKLADSGLHWGPFGEAWKAVFLNFLICE